MLEQEAAESQTTPTNMEAGKLWCAEQLGVPFTGTKELSPETFYQTIHFIDTDKQALLPWKQSNPDMSAGLIDYCND